MVGMLALSLLIAQAAAKGGFSEYGVVRNESSGSTLSHGEKLTFDCINSYQPAHGLITSICNNGTWNVIPRCEPDHMITAPKGNCDMPEIPNGMFVQIDGRNVTNNQTYVVGTEIFYKCTDPNKRLIDNSDLEVEHSRRVCDTATRSWKGSLLKCEATCGSLVDQLFRLTLNADDEQELRNVTFNETVLVGERYKVGTNALVYCNLTVFGPNYWSTTFSTIFVELNSTENVVHPTAASNIGIMAVCQSNGTWAGVSIPICGTDISIGLLPMLATTTAIMKTATMHKECGLNYFVKSDGKVSIRWTRLPLVATADTLRFTDQEHLGDSRP
ncbi:uncharacterized protein LOC116932914 isoform X2 [Daphnia magna]|uniref:uncharacterized protein LOC116932914 isoform X2 n=1 Tax=Daphnia magna TaxID=35525 RepID=UPI001E1BAE7C|nr:uncharacterized protein LOC116932914 isoform X2 [Daphnia magna]XP_045023360.1 uncharacterized protein LOC116932914 isoform X2 [Daphnia magna]